MSTPQQTIVTVENTVGAPAANVWEYWTRPEHIIQWSHAADDWHTTRSENDLREGGKFVSRMEAKDGSMGFDFGGTYDAVRPNEYLEYTLDDGRKVQVSFDAAGDQTSIVQKFVAESENPVEMQQAGWQAILDNFKKYTEAQA